MKTSLLSLLFVFGTMMSIPLSAQTLQQTPTQSPEPPKALKEAVEGGAQIYYLGEFEGLYGWSLVRQGKPEYYYMTKDRKAILMGILFDGEGEMITNGQLAQLHANEGDDMFALTGRIDDNAQQNTQAQEPVQGLATSIVPETLTPAQEMFVDIQAANWLTLGANGQNEIFAFIDPDCPHCQQFMAEAKPYIDNGTLKLRALPVGIAPQAEPKAALLLAADDPMGRFLRYGKGDKTALNPPANISVAAVAKNKSVMMDWGFDVTPIIVYKSGGGDIRMIRGRPRDFNAIFQDMAK